MGKIDYKKDYKDLYLPKIKPSIIDVPSMTFAIIEGEGDPNGDEFALATQALYGFSYTVKMSYRSKDVPAGYYDYTVFPLEGVWDLVDKSKPLTDKSNFAYSIMIRQPDFLTSDLFERFIFEVKKKKPNTYLDRIKIETITEGLCCQMLYCTDNGYSRSCLTHREIYLSDPRKTESSKLKTVLRFHVSKNS
ncbi:MAG: hypothetical protein K0R00_2643 [Herbinix sp.]|nr:hypothetical protein [Herbinix sp.]